MYICQDIHVKANRPLSNVLLHKHGQYLKMLFLKILPSANYRLVFAQIGTYTYLDVQQLQVGEQIRSSAQESFLLAL